MLHAFTLGAQEQPLFRASTRLVQVSVVVEDRDGRPVSGLTARDFRLFDEGQEQRIELFLTDAAATAAVPSSPAANPTATPAIREFSNRLSSRSSATVVLFDRLNTRDTDQIYARQHLFKFLEQVKGDDRVGLYVLEPDAIRVLHDFTGDARALVRAMARYRAMTSVEAAEVELPEVESTGNAAIDAAFAAALERMSQNMTAHFTGLRSESTTAALLAIASHLAGIDGRKNLIWVTAGFPLEAFAQRGKNMTTEIQRLIRPLNDANVTLYAVDARGLVPAISFGPGGKAAFATLSTVQTSQDIMQIAAGETGGRAFLNSNDIGGAVRRAVDDSRASYTLGYAPAHGQWNGKYRQIKVQVRRPDVRIRHRRGYLAASDGQRSTTAEAAVRAALQSPLEATGLEFTARFERLANQTSELKVVVSLSRGAISFAADGDRWKGAFALVLAQTLADGTHTRSVDRKVELTLTRERYEEAQARGLAIDFQTTLAPALRSVHIVVHDLLSGATGSIVVPADKLQSNQ